MLELYEEQIKNDTNIIKTANERSLRINVIQDQPIDEIKKRIETLLPFCVKRL